MSNIRPINKDYFNNIDTDEKAYFLGFLYADGYHLPRRNRISIQLAIKDIEILRKISFAIFSKDYVKEHISKIAYLDGRPIGPTKYARLEINNKQISEDLLRLGLINAKSLICEFPRFLSQDLLFSFLRGYFDGDGCLTYSLRGGSDRKYCLKFACSDVFALQLTEFLGNYQIYPKIYKQGKISILQIITKAGIQKLLELIYKNASIFLPRKYQKHLEFIDYLEDLKIKKQYKYIYFNKSAQLWRAMRYEQGNKMKTIGSFKTKEEAYLARQKFLLEQKQAP